MDHKTQQAVHAVVNPLVTAYTGVFGAVLNKVNPCTAHFQPLLVQDKKKAKKHTGSKTGCKIASGQTSYIT